MTRIHCLTLPSDDLEASTLFYRDGLGLVWQGKEDHAIFLLEGQLMIVVLRRAQFATFTEFAGQEVAPSGSSEVILSYFARSEEEVDSVLEQAVEYASYGEAAEQRPWGYSGFLTDPDGHIWEIMYNPDLLYGFSEGPGIS